MTFAVSLETPSKPTGLDNDSDMVGVRLGPTRSVFIGENLAIFAF